MPELSIEARLSQFPLFRGFSREELTIVSRLVQEREYQHRETLFEQGDEPHALYLLEQGIIREERVDAAGQTVPTRQAEAGDMVGRWAMFNNRPYPTMAYAHQPARVLAFDEEGLRSLLNTFPILRDRLGRAEVVNRLVAIPLFGSFSEDELFYLADLVKVTEYPAGATIFEQGDEADAFYVIDRGQVVEDVADAAPDTETWPKYLTAGNFFGRWALLRNTLRRSSAKARSDVRVLAISAYDFECLHNSRQEFRDALSRVDILQLLHQTRLFSQLSDEELQELAGYVGLAHFRKDDVIFYQGETDPTFYKLYEGEALARIRDERGRPRPVRPLTAGDTVGEPFLFFRTVCDFTLESTTDTNWLYLTRDDLDLFLALHPGAREKLLPDQAIAARQELQRFDWMEPDEDLVFETRRHWFFAASRLALPAVIVAVGGVLLLSGLMPAPLSLVGVLGLILLVLGAVLSLWFIVDWLNDYYVITDRRAVHQEKILLVRQTRDEAPLGKVQNVNIARLFVGNLLGFGTLLVNTAATYEARRLVFDYLADPEGIQAIILEQVERARFSERPETRRSVRRSLAEAVDVGIKPDVPRPVIPPGTAPEPAPPKPSVWNRIYQATLQNKFWIEQRTDDQVTWRKHWWRLIVHIWAPSLVILGLIVALVVLPPLIPVASPLVVLVLLVLFAPALFWLWWEWVDWGNDLYIVTNDRIIDTERLPFGFRYERTETTFDRIQNVSFEVPNPIATILNFGTVIIYTAGAEGRLDFEWVRSPGEIQTEIFRRLAAYEAAQRRQQREQQAAELPEWFAVYEETHRP